MAKFIGRSRELETLVNLRAKKSASLVVITGRRRIGKSRLAAEFGKGELFYSFSGLPPTKEVTAQTQRDFFAKQLQTNFKIPIKSDDWWDLLCFLAESTKKGRVIILLDEISWMGGEDPTFLGKLKTAWDDYFSKNSQLILILCSSISLWIDENILSNTGFLGRISLNLFLQELPLKECNLLWDGKSNTISAYEKFKILAITGGIPRYLEEINMNVPAEENIRRLCFTNSGILFSEFEQIFSELFDKRCEIYKKIVACLAAGSASRETIARKLKIQVGGVISNYLEDLLKSGFIARDFSWQLKDGKTSKISNYRLSDNYVRFYLKYILPNKNRIAAGGFDEKTLTALPGWSAILGLQFENLVLSNRTAVKNLLGIRAEEVLNEGPYLQRKTARQLGCQIDYMVQTVFNNLYICEIKFSKSEVKEEIIKEVKEKIAKLKFPRGFSFRPILIHVNGVSEEVVDSNYFSHIIDFSQLFAV